MLRLTAELGDGWVIPNQSVEDYRQKWEFIKEKARKVGRTASDIEPAHYAYASLSSSSNQAWRYAKDLILPERRRALNPGLTLKEVGDICLIGDPDEWVTRINEYIEAGAEHIIVKIVPLTQEALCLYGEKVIPHFGKNT